MYVGGISNYNISFLVYIHDIMYVLCRWKELELFVSFKKQQLHTAVGIQKYSEDIKETMVFVYVRMYAYA